MYGSPSQYQPQGVHWGWDVWGPEGTDVLSPSDGTVILSRENDEASKFWQWIIVEYADDICQLWGHLRRGTIPPLGAKVKREQKVGEIGNLHDALDSIEHTHTSFFANRQDALGIAATWPKSLDPAKVRGRYGETLPVVRAPGWGGTGVASAGEPALDVPCGCGA
jgi:hypothetical protein